MQERSSLNPTETYSIYVTWLSVEMRGQVEFLNLSLSFSESHERTRLEHERVDRLVLRPSRAGFGATRQDNRKKL